MAPTRLHAGVKKLDAGLSALYQAVDSLPASVKEDLEENPDYQALLGGLDQLIRGLRGQGPTDCEKGLAGIDPANCGAMDAVELVAGLLGDASEPGGDIDLLIESAKDAYEASASTNLPSPPLPSQVCPTSNAPQIPVPPVVPPSVLTAPFPPPGGFGLPANDVCVLISNVVYGLALPAGAVPSQPSGGLQRARPAQLPAALVEVYKGVDGEAITGLEQVKAGIPRLVDGILAGIEAQIIGALGKPTAGCDPTETLRCASAALVDGSAQVADGADELAAGLAGAADGSEDLADGADQLAAGLIGAGDGSSQLADGAGTSSLTGLGDAAGGSVQLADGADAAEAAPALPQGAERLSAEGTSLLVEAGDETA